MIPDAKHLSAKGPIVDDDSARTFALSYKPKFDEK